ncbi:MAG: sugar phosphate nucleotidyltransferase [Patescibacteria group bacterium]
MKRYGNKRNRKSRLTITLSPEILRYVDRTIDFKNIRNRSQAIETLLRQSLTPTITTAVILAGGPTHRKKLVALTTINYEKLIVLTLEHLVRFGIKKVIVLAGPNQKPIEKIINGGSSWGLKIIYGKEPKPLGTAGALKAVETELGAEPFLVLHGDILTDINLADFIAFHRQERTLATIAVKPRSSEKKYGQVLLEGNKITDFYEHDQGLGVSIVNTGVYLFEPEILSLIPPRQPVRLEADIFPKLAKQGELSAFLFQGIWFDITTPENYRQAVARWQATHGLTLQRLDNSSRAAN